jgi:hypothetical protein
VRQLNHIRSAKNELQLEPLIAERRAELMDEPTGR